MSDVSKSKTPFQVSYFGDFSLSRGEDRVDQQTLRSAQAAKLLALLIYHVREPYPTTRLIDMFWPGTTDDPVHTLTNLVYRLRKMLKNSWPEEKLICFAKGIYHWNPDVPMTVDVREFEALAEKIGQAKGDEKAEAQKALVALYKGKFLPMFSDDLEVLSLQNYYHEIYLKTVESLIRYYRDSHQYLELETLCRTASAIDPMDERIHCGMLEAYIGLNRFAEAEGYYRRTIVQMQEYLGGTASEPLQKIYDKMQKQLNSRETDLDSVLQEMKENEPERAAYLCEYGFFQKLYILQVRLKERLGIPVSIVLISLYADGREGQTIPSASTVMEQLGSTLQHVLRWGDAITRYSSSQYLIMLEGCSKENVSSVMERVYDRFYRVCKNRRIQIQYSVREIETSPAPAPREITVQGNIDRASISMIQGELFFRAADQWLAHREERVACAAIDINFFRLFNDIFGRERGSRLLEEIAEEAERTAGVLGGICGYLGNDDFCVMFPAAGKEYETLRPVMEEMVSRFPYTDGFAPIFGVYLSTQDQEHAADIYDRARAALAAIKGSYSQQYAFFDETHYRSVMENKILLMEARRGLDKGEFLIYLQPQVNERTGLIVGAEALVRWNRDGQICKPAVFLEEMEKSGFIYDLDRHVWEKVFAWMQDLKQRGIEPLPVSVNVSRVDFDYGDVAADFIGLAEQYGIDPELVAVEITETAFSDNLNRISEVTDRLHQRGFRICIDDFGSGSSSLSMLYQLDVDVLKTDIHFMSMVGKDEKAASIVESVISMAHMIGMMVIAEGVETAEQKERLISMGDTYVQGYYFYLPMPAAEYEVLLADPAKRGTPPRKGGRLLTSRLHFRDMISEGLLNDTLLDNIIGPAAVYQEKDDVISIVQMNEAYSRLTGIRPDDHEDMEKFIRRHYISGGPVREAFHRADHSLEGSYSEGIFARADGTDIVLRGRIFLLYSFEGHRIYMATLLLPDQDPVPVEP